MRLGKPWEHIQLAMKASENPHLKAFPVEKFTTIGRQIGYAGYLTYDALVWVRPGAAVLPFLMG